MVGTRKPAEGVQPAEKEEAVSAALRQQLADTRRLLRLCERERGLIANELHDGCVQDMVAAHMFLDVALSSLSRRSAARPHVEQAFERLRAALAEVRRVIAGIRLPALEQGGLKGALEQLVHDPRFAGLTIQLQIRMRRQRFLPTVELAVYRIVQEALTNVVKHSGVAQADVRVEEQDNRLTIQVRDQGRGFDLRSVPPGRMGLHSMRERASLLGGRCRISSRLGKGTLVQATVPLRDVLLERS